MGTEIESLNGFHCSEITASQTPLPDLARFLDYCQKSSLAPYVHKIPIVYPKDNKDNWSTTAFERAANLDTYQQSRRHELTANTRHAFFNTWKATWVGDSRGDTRYGMCDLMVSNPH